MLFVHQENPMLFVLAYNDSKAIWCDTTPAEIFKCFWGQKMNTFTPFGMKTWWATR